MRFTVDLKFRGIAAGYHLYASSYHRLGVAFYHTLGLEQLGKFEWRLHTGFEWVNVTDLSLTYECIG